MNWRHNETDRTLRYGSSDRRAGVRTDRRADDEYSEQFGDDDRLRRYQRRRLRLHARKCDGGAGCGSAWPGTLTSTTRVDDAGNSSGRRIAGNARDRGDAGDLSGCNTTGGGSSAPGEPGASATPRFGWCGAACGRNPNAGDGIASHGRRSGNGRIVTNERHGNQRRGDRGNNGCRRGFGGRRISAVGH
jgi:hypothetical protein